MHLPQMFRWRHLDRLAPLGRVAVLFVLSGLARAAQPAAGQEADQQTVEKTAFVRIARDEAERPLAMQTAIARYVPADGSPSGLQVDLVSAIHIADAAYYAALNERFQDYDAVLYELVAEAGTRVPEGGGGPNLNPVSLLQTGMQRMLKLSYQLEEIDYSRENFVHADMSPEQFAASMRERNESPLTMFFRMLGHSLAKQSEAGPRGPSDAEVLSALLKPNNSLPLKRLLAEQFEDMESMLGALSGPDGSTIITERNAVALATLRQQIEAGRRKLAIFYGGGHMPDMHQRLLADFGLKHQTSEWLTAWDLADPQPHSGEADSKGNSPNEPEAAEKPGLRVRPPRRRQLQEL